jgi:hypothetical protein
VTLFILMEYPGSVRKPPRAGIFWRVAGDAGIGAEMKGVFGQGSRQFNTGSRWSAGR